MPKYAHMTNSSPSRLLLATVALSVLAIAVAAALSSARAAQFEAGKPILKRLCERYDADFWSQGRRYGCGERVLCAAGMCQTRRVILLLREPDSFGGRGEEGGLGGRQ